METKYPFLVLVLPQSKHLITLTLIKLKNIIYSPSVSQNLLSASQLAAHNNIIIEFDSSSSFCKGQNHKVLLQGMLKDGLYQLNPTSYSHTPQAFLTSKNNTSSLSDWHKILGHPSHHVLLQVFKSCNVKYRSNENLSFVLLANMESHTNCLFKIQIYKLPNPLK